MTKDELYQERNKLNVERDIITLMFDLGLIYHIASSRQNSKYHQTVFTYFLLYKLILKI